MTIRYCGSEFAGAGVLCFAHGAGAGMTHPFMEQVATGLCDRGIATLRYQFPYMEKPASGRMRRRSLMPRCGPRWRKPRDAARGSCCRRQIVRRPHDVAGAGHRAAGRRPRTGVPGLSVASGGQAVDARARHLSDVHVPMLFVQGTRDKLAELQLLEPVVKRLGASASLHLVQEADHSFHVPARSGRNDREPWRSRWMRLLIEYPMLRQ